MLPRFRDGGDASAHGATLIGIGLAQRGLSEYSRALNTFAEAAELYRAAEQPLGEAEALYGHASILVAQERLQESAPVFETAIDHVERTLDHLAQPDDRAVFLRRWVNLYSDAILSYIRTDQGARARMLAESFAARADGTELAAQLKVFEESIPTKGSGLTREQQEQNKSIARQINELCKHLK